MKPLVTIERALVWLCLCSPDKATSKWKMLVCAFLGLITFTSTLSDMLASVAFMLKFISIDMEESLYALFQIFGFGSITYAIIVTFFQRHRMRDLFRGLSKIYSASKTDRETFYLVLKLI